MSKNERRSSVLCKGGCELNGTYAWFMENHVRLDDTPRFERDEVFEFETTWQGIDLNISYCPRWMCVDGAELITQHIEIRSDGTVALPITETGYRSCFLMGVDALKDYQDDPVAYILAWLKYAAQSKEWKDRVEQVRQGSLFD